MSSMASIQSPSPIIPLHLNRVKHVGVNITSTNMLSAKSCHANVGNCKRHRHCLLPKAKMSVEGDVLVKESPDINKSDGIGVVSVHHVGLLCENLERSLEFYQNLLGLKLNEARPHDKLPYRGAWLWVGSEMIHLMELPNPDPLTGRPEHGGRDRHACIAIRDVSKLKAIFDKAVFLTLLAGPGGQQSLCAIQMQMHWNSPRSKIDSCLNL